MGKQKFSIEFKLEVIGKYEMGTCGYKKLAKMYGLSRDTVRSWVLNPKLNPKKNSEEETFILFVLVRKDFFLAK